MSLLACSASISPQLQSHSPPQMHLHVPHLEGDRRRRAIAISSQQYAAHKERQKRSMKMKCSNVAQCSIINKTASSASTAPLLSSTSSDAVLSVKQERRAQLKAELDDEYEEALDILDDLSRPSSPLDNDDTSRRQTPGRLDLQDVAVMKPARRSSESSPPGRCSYDAMLLTVSLSVPVESEYVRVPPQSCKRLQSMDDDLESMEEEGWEMLDDDDCSSSSAPSGGSHDGHAPPPPPALPRTFAAVLVGGDSS